MPSDNSLKLSNVKFFVMRHAFKNHTCGWYYGTLICSGTGHIMKTDIQTDRQTTTNRAVILYMQPNSDGLGQITADRPGLTEWRKAQSPGCHHSVWQLSLSLPCEFGKICRMLLSNNLLLDSGCSHIRPGDSQEHRRCVILSKKKLLEMGFLVHSWVWNSWKRPQVNLVPSLVLSITSDYLLFEMARSPVLPMWYHKLLLPHPLVLSVISVSLCIALLLFCYFCPCIQKISQNCLFWFLNSLECWVLS